MKLNTPFMPSGDKILFVGIGGGYDIMGALPLAFTWNKKSVYANYNRHLDKMQKSPEGQIEGCLSQWLGEPVYALPRVGFRHMKHCLEEICSENDVNAIVAVDGGVDSIMLGDEEGAGTIIEDFVTMAAIDSLPVEHKFLACLGFGTELEEQVCHAHALDNMLVLANQGALFGSCCLTKDMNCYVKYKQACEYVWQNRSKSHIQTKVIAATEGMSRNAYVDISASLGEDVEIYDHVSPLMSLYWFFDLKTVVNNNKVIPELLKSTTHIDAGVIWRQMKHLHNRRPRKELPY